MAQTIDTTISTGFEPKTTVRNRDTRRLGRGARWALAGLAAAAIAVPVGVATTRTDGATAGSNTSVIAGQPATAADLQYANEWTQRLNHMTPTTPNTNVAAGQPATAADLQYANEWTQRLNHMTPTAPAAGK